MCYYVFGPVQADLWRIERGQYSALTTLGVVDISYATVVPC